jgi:hypothetical protein
MKSDPLNMYSNLAINATKAASEARKGLADLDVAIAKAQQERDVIIAAPLTKADFLALMKKRTYRFAQEFKKSMVRHLTQARPTYEQALMAGGDNFPYSPLVPGFGRSPQVMDLAMFFYCEEALSKGLESIADAMPWEEGAIAMDERGVLVERLDKHLAELQTLRAELVATFGGAQPVAGAALALTGPAAGADGVYVEPV